MMTMMTPKNHYFFACEKCDFVCSKKRDYERHLLTLKHKNDDKKAPENVKKYDCNCGKSFTYRQGLYVHRKTCKMDKNNESVIDVDITNDIITQQNDTQPDNTICSEDNISVTKEMFMTLLKDNQEMMKMIKSLSEQQLTTSQHITNNNNITNNFNLNIFLNEKCKDALNMSEFIDSIKITLDDLLFSKTNGITRGVTDVMMKRLKELDIHKRPIHCTDVKRDTMYIKDEDKWEKDNNHDKFKNTIVRVANKERSALQQWAIDNPDWIETEQKQIQYLTMVRSICEPIETYNNYERKIVKNIGKEILVEK
jgi:hypothetical protein